MKARHRERDGGTDGPSQSTQHDCDSVGSSESSKSELEKAMPGSCRSAGRSRGPIVNAARYSIAFAMFRDESVR
jgi:hypothetical protein